MMVVESLNRTESLGDITYIYSYRLTRGHISMNLKSENVLVQTYGIEVERQDFISGIMVNIERDRAENISPQRYKVHNLLRMIYEQGVSPIHLIEVLGEYIDDYIIDFDTYAAEATSN
ncbi:DUF6514 family protein [Clostridium thermarum]|uniref:DUF6514 family protein n=1 Tax=Clostridium thermarum TaxID=1716543 RepID=UPI00193EE4D9|nr:DUF6514 family protein [Clostridium thermarum]